MRVTHVITRLVVGGAQENTVASVLGLQQEPGLEVNLLSGPSFGPEGSLESAFRHRPTALQVVPHLVRPVHPWNDLRALRELTDAFQRTRPDIVHTHSGKAGILGRFAAARAGVPVIIHTIHGPSFGPFQGPLANLLFRTAERRAGRLTTHFVSVAHAMTDQYCRAGIGRPEQFTRIVSGFNLAPLLSAKNKPEIRARWGLGPSDIVVGKIARLFKLKGHDELLEAAPRLVQNCPQLRFLLVGDGAWRGRLAAKARALGVEKYFVFTGLVPPDTIPELIGVMDFIVHLSRREGLPRALPQALAAGRPVVAYDCDGAREVCLDGETGFLVRAGDLTGFTDRVLRLARDPALRGTLGKRGRELVEQQFGLDRMIAQLHRLYLELLERRKLTRA